MSRSGIVSVVGAVVLSAILALLSGCNGNIYIPDATIRVSSEVDRATLEVVLAVPADAERITAYEWKVDGVVIRQTDARIVVPMDRLVEHQAECSLYLRGSTTGTVIGNETFSDRVGGELWTTVTARIPTVSTTTESTADQL